MLLSIHPFVTMGKCNWQAGRTICIAERRSGPADESHHGKAEVRHRPTQRQDAAELGPGRRHQGPGTDRSGLGREEGACRGVGSGLSGRKALQLTQPIRLKDQLVTQLQTQIADLERFVDFLQDEGDSGKCVCGAGQPGGCPLHASGKILAAKRVGFEKPVRPATSHATRLTLLSDQRRLHLLHGEQDAVPAPGVRAVADGLPEREVPPQPAQAHGAGRALRVAGRGEGDSLVRSFYRSGAGTAGRGWSWRSSRWSRW